MDGKLEGASDVDVEHDLVDDLDLVRLRGVCDTTPRVGTFERSLTESPISWGINALFGNMLHTAVESFGGSLDDNAVEMLDTIA